MRPHRRTVVAAALAVAALVTAAACGGGEPTAEVAAPLTGACAGGPLPTAAPASQGPFDAPEQVVKADCEYTATIATEFGDIEIALDADAAPTTANSFVFLATRGYFDGLTFHRVVPGFVIQGGDPTGTGTGGPGYSLPDELPATDGYEAGAVAMANSGPDTSGSQFFIVTGDASGLPAAYSRFGTVTAGLDAARAIEGLADPEADPGDPAAQRPTRPAVIESITITES